MKQARIDELLEAIALRDFPRVSSIIDSEIEVNQQENRAFNSPLAKAINSDRPDLVQQLLAAGADVNWVPRDGDYPLCGAANGGYEDIFEYLLPLTEPQLKEPEIPLFVERLKHRKQHHCFCYTTIVHSVADPVVNVKRRPNPVAKINLSRHPEREAALWMAAYWGDEFLADTLLAAGADGNCQIDYRPFAPDSLEPVLWKHGQNLSGIPLLSLSEFN